MKLIYTIVTLLIFSHSFLLASELAIDTHEILQSHNKLRNIYNSPPLIYSKKLEKAAKKWAKKLQKDGCHMVHSRGKVGQYGENLFWASPRVSIQTSSNGTTKRSSKAQVVSSTQVSKAWHDEVQWYNYEDGSCKQGEMCGHFTQLVWDTTKELGCAAALCGDKSQVWVCEYYPAGNISVRHTDGSIEKLKPYKK